MNTGTVTDKKFCSMKEAAKSRNVSLVCLYAKLRQRGYFCSDNIPKKEWIKDGYFFLQPEQYRKGNLYKQYEKVMVTGTLGISLISELADEIKAEIAAKKAAKKQEKSECHAA